MTAIKPPDPTSVLEVPANQTGTGLIISMVCGEPITLGSVLCLKTDGLVWRADADTVGLYPAFAIALANGNAGARINVLVHGIYRDDALFNWTVGGVVYLATSAGGMTQVQPVATDNCIQVLGLATHADRLYFSPDLTWITHT